MPKRIFIGSSSEALAVARQLQLSLNTEYGGQYLARLWNQNIIALGQNILPAIIEEIKNSEYGVFVFNGDDLLIKRSNPVSVVRDNVLFELGLAVGILGLERCYIVKSNGVEIPSDFSGVQYSSYKAELLERDAATVIGTVANEINGAIARLDAGRAISWEAYCRAADQLSQSIHKSARQGGYRYEMIVGVSRGGLIAADMLGRVSGASTPVVSYWADDIDEDQLSDYNANLLSFISGSKYSKILLIDDISRTGASMERLAQRLRERCTESIIKTGVLFAGRENQHNSDFVGALLEDDAIRSMHMPYEAKMHI